MSDELRDLYRACKRDVFRYAYGGYTEDELRDALRPKLLAAYNIRKDDPKWAAFNTADGPVEDVAAREREYVEQARAVAAALEVAK